MTIEQLAREHALRNRTDFGKADAKVVFSKIIRDSPEAKKDPKAALARVQKVVDEVNLLVSSALEKEASALKPVEKPTASGSDEHRMELENAEQGKVVTRFLPEPNGTSHIGHAKAAWLSRTVADNYGGKCILRFDDTNPDAEKQEYVDGLREGVAWLGLHFDGKETYTSDKMPQLYQYAERMLAKGDLYVCQCSQEEMSKGRTESIACAHRSRAPSENLALWKDMLAGKFKEGQAIVRLRGDLSSLNTVMRDPTMFRIIQTPHYRQGDKYVVWPTYDFEVSIADSLDGVTHALRSKEYELRDELYYAIIDKAGLRKPIVYDFSRLNIKGTALSKRKLKPLIEEKKVDGWTDPRLPTLGGLRRRGILPESIKGFVLSFGLSKVESEPSWEALLVENRKRLDPVAQRFNFVREPVKVIVENPPATLKEVKVHRHPGNEELGTRIVKVTNEFYIPGKDAEALKEGEVFRLKDVYNVKLTGRQQKGGNRVLTAEFHSTELIADSKKIQWVPAQPDGYLPATLLTPGELFINDQFNPESLKTEKGYVEAGVKELKVGDVVQFLRVGFVRLDDAQRQVYIFSC